MVRKADHTPAKTVGFRHLWGQSKPADLIATADVKPDNLYEAVTPSLPLGLPFAPLTVSGGWADSPSLPKLFPASYPGVQTKRDAFLIDVDSNRLKARIGDYFNPQLSHEEIARRYPAAMKSSSGFVVSDAHLVRNALLARGGPDEGGFIRFSYRPFDIRWLYWDAGRGLLGRPSPDYRSQAFQENMFIEARERESKEDYSRGTLIRGMADNFGNGFSNFFPTYLRVDGLFHHVSKDGLRPNLSDAAQSYLEKLGLGVEDLFHHVLAILHDPAYREANAGALRMEWPRIPASRLARRGSSRRGRGTGGIGCPWT